MVEFIVSVPDDTPPDEPVYLTGDAEALGSWQADGVSLAAWGDGTHRAQLALKPGTVRFLVTQGHWRQAENDGHDRERPSRTLTVNGSVTVEVRVAGWGRDAVRYHPDVTSEFLPSARPVAVWLPPGYDVEPHARYPVLYMNDGQNLFDTETAFGGVPWRCDSVAERMIRSGRCRPMMIVGVGNSPDRLREYGPREEPQPDDVSREYARFLVEELKPVIDRTYRTLPGPASTAIGGSSMGGLVALHIAAWHPDHFGLCAAISPSLWWDAESFLRTGVQSWPESVRLWLDMGGQEGPTPAAMRANVRRARRLAVRLRRHGADLRYTEYADAGHNEADWGARFDDVLPYLFPREERLSSRCST